MHDRASGPYRAERYAIGHARDGRALFVEPVDPAKAAELGGAISKIGPWAHYGWGGEQIVRSLQRRDAGVSCYQIRCGDAIAGGIAIQPNWLLGPYLQMLAILPEFQKLGLGARVIGWYEAEARAHKQRNIWLCVSGFNNGAAKFYARHDFVMTAVLDGLVRRGDDELLMRKLLHD
jgi:diamine N-acetyltransferase